MPISRREQNQQAWQLREMRRKLGLTPGARPPVPTKRNQRKPVTRFHTDVYVPPLGSIAMQFLGIVRR